MKSKFHFFFLAVLIFSSGVMVACTSSEGEDTSVLEAELENLDGADESGDLDSMDEADSLEEELAELDEDLGDGESMSEGDGDEMAAADEGGSDDEEFADLEDENFDNDFDDEAFNEGDEQALAQELGEDQQYPEANGAEPAFPEEVIAEKADAQPVPPSADLAPVNPPGSDMPVITSKTTDLGEIVPEVTEPELPQHDLGKADPLIPKEEDEAGQNWIPVVKIKEDPFFRNERLMNSVYIARPGDTLPNISNKIYGADKSSQLLDDNNHLAKGIDPGDKVYYTSPNRPEDKSTLKVYYDDIGLPPQKYITQQGDNIRRLGSKLLGFPEGWKELWAINPQVDSKTILPDGTELRYWTGEEQPVQVMAQTEEVPVADPEGSDPGAMEMAGSTEPPPPAATELPPEPPLPEASMAMPDDQSLQPEVLPEVEPLPESEISEVPQSPVVEVVPADDGGSLLTVGAVALLVLAMGALVAIQIKNRKANTEVTPPSLEYTQV
ncbi:MAG: hypothetical protein KDD33_11380 [Bdellovibrionales bacterium]|nr:hypothetical protein [Bdellovibrionales bacterium]